MNEILKSALRFNIFFFIFISVSAASHEFSINETTVDIGSNFNECLVTSMNCTDVHPLSEEKPWQHFRLPKHMYPIHYDLFLRLDLINDSFNGEVSITVNVTKGTKYFIVHAKQLTVTNYEVQNSQTNVTMGVENTIFNQEMDYFILKMNDQVIPGIYILRFSFYNSFQKNYVWYIDENTETKSYASTFFAPNYARNVFPCFDEPSFKATFSVTVLHEKIYSALSNAEIKSITYPKNDQILTEFEKSPPMSTYILCIFLSDFTFKETITENGVRLRVYSPNVTIEKTEFALTSADKVLTHFENSFGIPFPLKKLDLISLPYFDINGMENWGLITFWDTSFLIDNTSTVSQKMKTANLIAHELAHMWFGDLVTMEWFSDTWLNEGFATHFAWKGVKTVLPEYFEINDDGIQEMYSIMEEDTPLNYSFINQNISELITATTFDDVICNETNFNLQELYHIFEEYGNVKSSPVVREISELKFGDVYDSIVYKKGSSILRMMEYLMGEDFLQGISKYLSKYSFGNVNTDDLWRDLTAVSKQKLDIKEIMDPWVKQVSYPIITIKSEEGGNDGNQKQYEISIDPGSSYSMGEFPNQYTWNIPLYYRAVGNSSVNYLMLNSTNPVYLSVPHSSWLKFNADFTGYYSVNYDLNTWKQFITILETNHNIFSPSDRVNLLFDSFNLASLGIISYEIPLNLTRYLMKEEYHEAWTLGLKCLSSIKEFFSDDRFMMSSISKYIRSLSENLYTKFGWIDKGNFLEKKIRSVLIEAACSNDNYECLETAVETFANWMKEEEIESETSKHVYKYGLQEIMGEKPFDFLWNRYLKESNPLKKVTFRNALPAVANEFLLTRLLEYSMNETYLNPTLRHSMLKSIANNRKGFPIVADYVLSWDDLVRNLGINGAESAAHDVLKLYQTPKDLKKILKFYKKHPATKEAIKTRAKTLQMVRKRIDWLEKHKDNVKKWFQNNVQQDNHVSNSSETVTN